MSEAGPGMESKFDIQGAGNLDWEFYEQTRKSRGGSLAWLSLGCHWEGQVSLYCARCVDGAEVDACPDKWRPTSRQREETAG